MSSCTIFGLFFSYVSISFGPFHTLLLLTIPHSLFTLHERTPKIDIGLLREIGRYKMGIYKGINHPLHLRLVTHSFSELGIRGPSKDVVPQQGPLYLVPTRWTMLG